MIFSPVVLAISCGTVPGYGLRIPVSRGNFKRRRNSNLRQNIHLTWAAEILAMVTFILLMV